MNTAGASDRRWLLAAAAIAALCVIVYAPVWHAQFVALDDPQYVTENPMLAHGLTLEAIVWAFTTTYAANYHPLTWLSHLVDVQLFGFDPRWHHLVNVGWHMANAVLLLLWLFRATGALWRSAVVAALFAVHPLHVESVAWVAERKDVLSTCCWFLALLAYVGYVKRRSARRYAAVLAWFVLGLLAKPMVVTLPVTLLLLDCWPFERLFVSGRLSGQVVREKIPFVVLAIASGVVTVYAQHAGGAVVTLANAPIASRIGNATIDYVAYLGKLVWPHPLLVLYSVRSAIPIWQLAAASAALAAITLGVFRLRHRAPFLVTGWLWFVATLVPVIGLIQVGLQSMADRYTYVPSVGIFIAAVWGIASLVRGSRRESILGALTVVAVVSYAAVARAQVHVWENTTQLWSHAAQFTIHVDREQALLEVGRTFHAQGRVSEAIDTFETAAREFPSSPGPAFELGSALADASRNDEAAASLETAIRLDPAMGPAHAVLGLVRSRQGRTDEAIDEYRTALRLDPGGAEIHNNLGVALAGRRQFALAEPEFAAAARLEPDFVSALVNEALALHELGHDDDARKPLAHALQVDPTNAPAQRARALIGPGQP